MAIAPLPPEYLSSPTSGGAITSAAARLFAEEGRRLAQTIEETALKNEAGAKAPALAAAYATGLSKLAQGDMTGFEYLTKAEAEAVGNPFLMAMNKNATAEGARMAQSFMLSQRQEASQTNVLDRQMESQRAMFDRQAEDDWRSSAAAIDKQYAEDYEKWRKGEMGRRRQSEIEGVPFTPTEPPQKPAYPQRPAPTSRTFGGTPSAATGGGEAAMPSGGATAGGGTFDTGIIEGEAPSVGATPMPGTPATAESVRSLVPEASQNKNASAIYAKVAAGENAMTGRLMQGDSLVNEALEAPEQPRVILNERSTTAPAEGIELGVQRAPEQRGNEVVIPLGRMNWKVRVDPQKKLKVSETVNTETGSKTYTMQNTGDDKVDKFMESLGKVESLDYDLAQWTSANMMQGKKITMEPIPGGDKDSAWIAKANGEPFGMENPERAKKPEDKSIPATIARPVSEEVGKLWNEASSLLPQIKDRVSIEYPPTKEDVQKDKEYAIDEIVKGNDTLDSVNRKRKKVGLPLVTENEVKEVASKRRPPEAEKLGIKTPQEMGEEVGAGDRKKYAKKKVESIDRQITSLKKKYMKSPTQQVFDDLAALQRTKEQWEQYL